MPRPAEPEQIQPGAAGGLMSMLTGVLTCESLWVTERLRCRARATEGAPSGSGSLAPLVNRSPSPLRTRLDPARAAIKARLARAVAPPLQIADIFPSISEEFGPYTHLFQGNVL